MWLSSTIAVFLSSNVNRSRDNHVARSCALISSISILITIELISHLKKGYSNLGDWINAHSLLYEKTLTQPMIDKVIDEKQAYELKEVPDHYLDKRTDIMRITQSKVEEVFWSFFK